MALSDLERLFSTLLRQSGGQHVQGWDSWLLAAAQTELKRDAADAAAFVEANRVRLWNAFLARNEELKRTKGFPALIVVNDRSRLFRIAGPEDSGSKATATVLRDRFQIIRFIDSLSYRQFEYLGAVLSKYVGARNIHVTPSGNEGGVDFYADVPAWGRSDIFHSPHKSFRVVGQSKFYTDRVGVAKSRELCKVLDAIRHRDVKMEPRVPGWFKDARGPIMGVIVAPYGFQSGLLEDCHQHGIMVADGIDVAHSIAGSRAFKDERSKNRAVNDILLAALADVGCI